MHVRTVKDQLLKSLKKLFIVERSVLKTCFFEYLFWILAFLERGVYFHL